MSIVGVGPSLRGREPRGRRRRRRSDARAAAATGRRAAWEPPQGSPAGARRPHLTPTRTEAAGRARSRSLSFPTGEKGPRPAPAPPRRAMAGAGERRSGAPHLPAQVRGRPVPHPHARQVTAKGKEPRPHREQTQPPPNPAVPMPSPPVRQRSWQVSPLASPTLPAPCTGVAKGGGEFWKLGLTLVRFYLLFPPYPRGLSGKVVQVSRAERDGALLRTTTPERHRRKRAFVGFLSALFSASGYLLERPQGGVKPRATRRTTTPVMPCGRASQPFRERGSFTELY